MERLFILGNGFDRSHGLPTSYEDFHKYLLENYPDSTKESPSFNISSRTAPDGDEVYDDNEAVAFLMQVISNAEKDGDDWCDIETNLGHLDFNDFFDDISYLFDDEEDDDNFYRDDYLRREGASINFRMVTLTIKDYFSDWINTIEISEVIPKPLLQELLSDGENHVLNFNYTKVVELIYGVIDVTHIHGVVNRDIIIGHGAEDNFDENEDDINYELQELHNLLKKPTQKIIQKYESFFNKLKNVTQIYSFGFSFSDVDLPYIRKICASINTTKNAVWYLSSFGSDEERENHKTKIRDCGFMGTFDLFEL